MGMRRESSILTLHRMSFSTIMRTFSNSSLGCVNWQIIQISSSRNTNKTVKAHLYVESATMKHKMQSVLNVTTSSAECVSQSTSTEVSMNTLSVQSAA